MKKDVNISMFMQKEKNKKKIGILTYHTGYNYGASLQNYALQTVINKMGFTVETINFETERFVASREMFSRKIERPKELIKVLMRIPYAKSLKRRQQLFDDFTKNYLNTTPLYRTEQEVIDHAIDYECIVCGSDQIWNVSQKAVPAANYLFFLNFPKKQRRVSYAASFGEWVREAPKYENEFLLWLKHFDFISVRETSGVDYVKSLGLKCELCLDPTVLLDKDDYDVICSERLINEKYIVMFGWNTNIDLINAAKKVSKELRLPVYNIVPPPRGFGSKIPRKLDVGPCEFLSMIKYAEFVVTNSFHGTAFATIYEKPYVSIVSGGIADSRMESLLKQLGLEGNLSTVDAFNVNKLLNTDYKDVKKRKVELRRNSLTYLKRAFSGLEEKDD